MPQIYRGIVTKAGHALKTIVVTTSRKFEHPKYVKIMERTKKYQVHDEFQLARAGDRVTMIHRPNITHTKQFTLHSIDRSTYLKAEDQVQLPPKIPEYLRVPVSKEEPDFKKRLGMAARARRPARQFQWNRMMKRTKKQRNARRRSAAAASGLEDGMSELTLGQKTEGGQP